MRRSGARISVGSELDPKAYAQVRKSGECEKLDFYSQLLARTWFAGKR